MGKQEKQRKLKIDYLKILESKFDCGVTKYLMKVISQIFIKWQYLNIQNL